MKYAIIFISLFISNQNVSQEIFIQNFKRSENIQQYYDNAFKLLVSKENTVNPLQGEQVPTNTEIKLKSLQKVVVRDANKYDQYKFEVVEDLIIDNRVIIKRGTSLTGKVRNIIRAKSLGKEGTMELIINSINEPNGLNVKFKPKNIVGKNKLTSVIVSSILLSPIMLLTKGGEARIKEGEIVFVYTE